MRTQTLVFNFQGEGAITGVKRLIRSLSDTDDTLEMLNKEMGKHVKVTKDTVKSKRELESEARRLITQQERTKKSVRELTRYYDHQKVAIKGNADQQEVLNAVYKLGAHATDEQKQKVTELVKGYQKVREGANQTHGSFRNLRGVTQQLGWQLSDVAVQVGTNTNLFTIFAQQGSQMAAAFGPIGSLIGAGIAIGGTAMAVFQKATQNTRVDISELEEAVKSLKGEMSKKEGFSLDTTDIFKIKTIQQVDKEIGSLNTAITKNAKKLGEAAIEFNKYNEFNKAGIHGLSKWNKAQEDSTLVYIKAQREIKALVEIKRLMGIADGRSLKKTHEDEKATKKMIETIEKESNALGKSERQKALAELTKQKATVTDIKRLNDAYDYIDAEEALTEEIKASDKAIKDRETTRNAIQKGIDQQFKKTSPIAAEIVLFKANKKELLDQLDELGTSKLDQQAEINALMEAENKRHKSVMASTTENLLLSELKGYAVFTGALGNIFGRLNGLAEEGTEKAKQLFYVNQMIAIADAIVNTELGATKAMGQAGILGFNASQIIRAQGYAAVGIIAGQTIAGAYDKGGNIPSGKLGIVSEYGDELVNGHLVKGPARVTSREDTAKMLGGSNVTVINNAPGVTLREERTSSNDIRIIAEQTFSNNIDAGVAGVLANRNSKSTKSIKRNFNVRNNF